MLYVDFFVNCQDPEELKPNAILDWPQEKIKYSEEAYKSLNLR